MAQKTPCQLIHTPPRSWVEVNTHALRHNVQAIKQLVPSASFLPIIKANAYGHGACHIAEILAEEVDIFGVANVSEALILRESGIQRDIVLLGPCLPEERALVLQHGFLASVSSIEEALAYCALASPEHPARLHFVIDTGMGRIGAWKEDALVVLSKLKTKPQCRIEIISTHLAAADEDAEAYTGAQLDWFAAAIPNLRSWFPCVRFTALNSAGILRYPQFAFDLVRPGLMLYGISPVPEGAGLLQPVLAWKTKIALVRNLPAGRHISYGGDFVTSRPSTIASLTVGYADGFFRQIRSGTAQVLINGHRCPVIGRVTMDLILADVTEADGVETGAVVTLLGKDGAEEITATEMAQWAGTIPWHIFTAIGPRVQHHTS